MHLRENDSGPSTNMVWQQPTLILHILFCLTLSKSYCISPEKTDQWRNFIETSHMYSCKHFDVSPETITVCQPIWSNGSHLWFSVFLFTYHCNNTVPYPIPTTPSISPYPTPRHLTTTTLPHQPYHCTTSLPLDTGVQVFIGLSVCWFVCLCTYIHPWVDLKIGVHYSKTVRDRIEFSYITCSWNDVTFLTLTWAGVTPPSTELYFINLFICWFI